jgi:hypothetical protein
MLVLFCLPLALIFGIIGIFKDRPRWLAIVVTAGALLLISPWLIGLVNACR